MKNSSLLNSPRLQELKNKHRKIIRKKIFIFLTLFLFLLIGLTFLSKWESLNIDNIEIKGNKIIETNEIKDIVKGKITGDYLWIFPKTNFLIYPKNEIKTALKNKYKRIKDIIINNKNIKTLEVSIVERTALYTYCGLNPETLIEEKCYFMDDGGFIFDEAPYFSGEVYLKFYGQTSSDSYFFKGNFSKLVTLQETLKKIGIKVAVFYLEDSGDIRMYLTSKIKSRLGPVVIFKANADFNEIIENLQSVFTTEPLQSDLKNKYSSLLYIDLRYGNKVYYKFNTDKTPSSIAN